MTSRIRRKTSLARASRCFDGLSGKIKTATERVGQLARAIGLGQGNTCYGTAAPFPRDDDCAQGEANDVFDKENVTCRREKEQYGCDPEESSRRPTQRPK